MDKKQIIAQQREEQNARAKAYAAERFGLPVSDVIGYHSGICYSKIWVRTLASAKKVSEAVKGETVNGGWFDGMSLGGIDTSLDKEVTLYEVIC